jgi:hypothetical protein
MQPHAVAKGGGPSRLQSARLVAAVAGSLAARHAMTNRTLILFVAASLALVSAAFAGEVVLQEHHFAVSLPDGWHQVPEKRDGFLLRAESDSGRLRFMFTRPPIPMKPVRVQDVDFQKGIKQSLRDQGFPKIVRSEVVKIASADAYLCEATRDDKPYTTLQVAWFHEGRFHSLVFASLAKPLKDVPDIQTIIDSVRVLPKQ